MSADILSRPPLRADHRVTYGEDRSQFFDLFCPAGPSVGMAVMIHGGFWRARYDLGHASRLCAALAASGVVTANLEYRRAGQPGGGWPGTFDDVVAGVQAASKYLGEAPVVIGHSAGGHLALRLAIEPVPLRAVVALAPVANLQLAYELNLSNGAVAEFLGNTPAASPDRYKEACPSAQPAAIHRVVVHGTDDDVVPLAISRAFVEARKSDPEPPSLIEISKADHFDLIDPESHAWPMVHDVVLQLLRA